MLYDFIIAKAEENNNVLNVSGFLVNKSEHPITISHGGVTNGREVSLALVQIERLGQNGVWDDVTPMADGLGVQLSIKPQERVDVTATLPAVRLDNGGQYRLVCGGLRSSVFTRTTGLDAPPPPSK
jgi:hypothetical protein